MPVSMVVCGAPQGFALDKSLPIKVPDPLLNVRAISPDPQGWNNCPSGERRHCSVMSTVSLKTATYSSKTSQKQATQRVGSFTRSFSLTSSCEDIRLVSADRRSSLDDILDEREEETKPERTSSLSQLLDLDSASDVKVTRDFVRQFSTTQKTSTMSGGFFKKKLTEDISSSLSSLSKSKIVISSSLKTSTASQSAHNLNQATKAEPKPPSCPLMQMLQRPKAKSKSVQMSKLTMQAIQDDLDILKKGEDSPELEKAMLRIIEKMDILVDNLKAATEKKDIIETLDSMNLYIRASWAVSTYGYDLGSNLCNTVREKGGLNIILNNFRSTDDEIKFKSACFLEQALTTENRAFVVRNGLSTVVKVACEYSAVEEKNEPTGPTISQNEEKSRIAIGILEHLFKHSDNTCQEVIRMGGLKAILYHCRNTDIETLRHCAAALANLSLHGGCDSHECMVMHKAPEWLFPLAFHKDDNIKYYACLAIAALVANKEIEAAVIRSGTLELVEPFVTSHYPDVFAQSTVAHAHGQSKSWLKQLVPVLASKREEARSLAAFHFAMEAGIKKRQGNTHLFPEIGVICALKKVASSPNCIASKYAAQALMLIGEEVPHKLSQQVPLWTVEDVVEWVIQIGFSSCSSNFSDNRVDGDLLLQLNDQILTEDIGITNGILRKRFLRDLVQLKRMADYSSCDTSGLSTLLQGLGTEFCQYTYPMLLSGVNRDNMRYLSEDNLLNECGIINSIHRLRIMQAILGMNENRNELDLEDLNSKRLDVFISYRRSNGSQLASLLKVHLQLRGFSVFIDVERLEAGKFDSNLLTSVRQAKHFLLVLTSGALDRCVMDTDCKDWVHREIVEALDCQCNIIPILDNFKWPDPETLPEDMRAIPSFNGVRWVHDYQDACVDKLEKFMRKDMNVKSDGSLSRLLHMGSSTPGTPNSISRSLPNQPFHGSMSIDSDRESNGF